MSLDFNVHLNTSTIPSSDFSLANTLDQNIIEPKLSFESKISVDQFALQRQWYHQYPDVMLSLILIGTGVIHILFKKFIMPSKKVIKDELDHQRALENFYSSPYFGIILIGLGLVLLFCSGIYYYLKP